MLIFTLYVTEVKFQKQSPHVPFAQLSHVKSWPVEYLRMSWQSADRRMISHHGRPDMLPGTLRACCLCASLCEILIDWTGSAILGHFVKAVKIIGIQQAGRQSGDRAYFVVLIESRSPSPSRSRQERGSGGIDNNYLPSSHFVPQHLSKLNRTPWIIHNIKCSIYTAPIDWLLLALLSLWNHERITATLSLMVLY